MFSEPAVAVFPATGDDADRLISNLRLAGFRVVPVWGGVGEVRPDAEGTLPSIYSRTFSRDIQALVREYEITHIATTSDAVYFRLVQEAKALGISISPQSPSAMRFQDERRWSVESRSLEDLYRQTRLGIGGQEVRTTEWTFIRSALRHARTIPGQCSLSKMAVIAAIAGSVPAGDVVEIGSFYGRSTWFLWQLARYFRIGATIAIDGWDATVAHQSNAGAVIGHIQQDEDWGTIRSAFIDVMGNAVSQDFNYISANSRSAVQIYMGASQLWTEEFGESQITGRISLLHIDGNHDYDEVSHDLQEWTRLASSGSWIVCDDYRWLHGEGPHAATDEFLFAHAREISNVFVCGNSAYIQMR